MGSGDANQGLDNRLQMVGHACCLLLWVQLARPSGRACSTSCLSVSSAPDMNVGLTGRLFSPCRCSSQVFACTCSGSCSGLGASAGRARIHTDGPDDVGLEDADQLQPDHLQQREERHDSPARVWMSANGSSNPHASVSTGRTSAARSDPHRNLLRRQIESMRARLRALDHGLERADQAEGSISISGSGASPAISRSAVRPRPLRAAQRLALVQQPAAALNFTIAPAAGASALARILPGSSCVRVRAGQQHARLDVNQRRGHHCRTPRHVRVHLLHQVDVADLAS